MSVLKKLDADRNVQNRLFWGSSIGATERAALRIALE
jgi:hypothetical protein